MKSRGSGSPSSSSGGASRLVLFGALLLGGFVALHWSVIFALQSVARFESGGDRGGESGGSGSSSLRSTVHSIHSVMYRKGGTEPTKTPPPPASKARLLPPRGDAAAARPFAPPGFGRFKLAGDPALCKRRKWKWCYIGGNVETFRRVFGVRNPLTAMRETPALPMDLEGGGPWQLLWQLADETSRDHYATTRRLKWFQKINHFPQVRELGNKRYLTRNMAAAATHFGADVYDVFPRSFQVPAQLGAWQTAHRLALQKQQAQASAVAAGTRILGGHHHKPLYIIKASAKDRGEGIRVVSGPGDLAPGEKGVVQSYLQYPYLLNGYKFTMRIYAAYTSVDPVRLYLYPEGFVHMATDKYDPDPAKLRERYMHLTNPDINKERPFYKRNPRPFYWNFKELRAYIREHAGGDDDLVWRRIQTLAAKTLLCAEKKISASAQEIVPFRGNSFEMIGMDVLIDDNLKPWLLEVNPDPDMSAHAGFQLAYETKGHMLEDLLHLLGLGSAHRSEAYQMGRSEMIQNVLDASKAEAEGSAAAAPPALSPMWRQAGFLARDEKGHQKNMKHEGKYGCDLGKTAVACGVGTNAALAGIVAETSLEYTRERSWERVLPNGVDGAYLKWFYEVKAADKMLHCWESEVMACMGRKEMDCTLCREKK